MAATKTAWLTGEELQAWESFLRASTRLLERLDAELQPFGISLADYEILVHLAAEPAGELRMTALAARTLVSRSGLTRRLDRLVDAGLVERRICATDRRGVLAVLTPAGRRRLDESAPTHVEGVRRHFLSQLGGQNLHDLTEALDAVVESSERDMASAPRSSQN